jgi:inhibitor of cysteine peptidase
MIKVWVGLLITLLIGSVGCTMASEGMKLTENDSGKTVELQVGDELEIALPANPTTGYVWEVSSVDSVVLKLDKSDFFVGDKMIGSGGTTVMKLHAITSGSSSVKLIYHRPFERNKPPLKNFSIHVQIKK